MEQHHDAELAARLAKLDARRQAGAAATRPSTSGRRRRRHVAHRSRVAVTVGSVAAVIGMTGAMALGEAASNSAAVAVTDATVASNGASSASTVSTASTASTVTAATAATVTTQAATQSSGS